MAADGPQRRRWQRRRRQLLLLAQQRAAACGSRLLLLLLLREVAVVLDPYRAELGPLVLGYTGAVVVVCVKGAWVPRGLAGRRRARLLSPWAHLDASVVEQPLEVAYVRQQAALLVLELLEVAAALRPASHAVRDIALQVLLRAVCASVGEPVTAYLAHLLSDAVRIG